MYYENERYETLYAIIQLFGLIFAVASMFAGIFLVAIGAGNVTRIMFLVNLVSSAACVVSGEKKAKHTCCSTEHLSVSDFRREARIEAGKIVAAVIGVIAIIAGLILITEGPEDPSPVQTMFVLAGIALGTIIELQEKQDII